MQSPSIILLSFLSLWVLLCPPLPLAAQRTPTGTGTGTGTDTDTDTDTDRNADRLARYLQENPKSDLDGDGTLTMDERRAYLRRNRPATSENKSNPSKQNPAHQDIAYGPHERNVLDLYLARSDKPTPLVIHIHGGGFRGGDKGGISQGLIRLCQEAGFSVASLNYRLTDSAPFPAQMHDCARAVQFLRSNAKKYHLDKNRFGATGGSAGAGISLWLGMHDDLADPRSGDPVARESTRVKTMAVSGAQVAYDPRWIKKYIGGNAHRHPALTPFFNIQPGEEDSPKTDALYQEASPINFLTKDDGPVWAIYREPPDDLREDAPDGNGIHHIKFGWELKKRMDRLGIECVVVHVTDFEGGEMNVWPRQIMDREIAAFFVKHL